MLKLDGVDKSQVDQPSNSILSRKQFFVNFSFNFNEKKIILIVKVHKSTLNISVRGHPFMTSTKKLRFSPPLSTIVHMGRIPPPPCGRPHTVDVKYTPTALLKWLVR